MISSTDMIIRPVLSGNINVVQLLSKKSQNSKRQFDFRSLADVRYRYRLCFSFMFSSFPELNFPETHRQQDKKTANLLITYQECVANQQPYSQGRYENRMANPKKYRDKKNTRYSSLSYVGTIGVPENTDTLNRRKVVRQEPTVTHRSCLPHLPSIHFRVYHHFTHSYRAHITSQCYYWPKSAICPLKEATLARGLYFRLPRLLTW